jgi:N-acetylglucosaminyl-diphospho-decaprenol L-rhamnosyltransferase
VAAGLPRLAEQLREGDELIVVDNDSSDGTPRAVREAVSGATLIEMGSNRGFGAACNRGANAASGELLVFLNPDAVPSAGFRDAIERPLTEARGWGAWQALVTSDAGSIVNTKGGVVHFTGIAWAGGAGDPLEGADSALPEPGFVSGACLAIPRESFHAMGAFPEEFFLYHEDVDLSLRLRLAGERLGVEGSARVDHHYEFLKGPAKWRFLERNRWATLIRTYPVGLLALLAPGLLATELALIPISVAGGWLRPKLRAGADGVRWLPRLIRERRKIQARRAVPVRDFARALAADLDSPYLGGAGRSRLLRGLLRGYWSVVLRVLRA